jgi:hypothetical protein
LWCIGERGFVLGLELGMAIEEERDRVRQRWGRRRKCKDYCFEW